MKKYKRKRTKAISAGKPRGQTKAKEYVSNLLELHKIQGVLLNRLNKEV